MHSDMERRCGCSRGSIKLCPNKWHHCCPVYFVLGCRGLGKLLWPSQEETGFVTEHWKDLVCAGADCKVLYTALFLLSLQMSKEEAELKESNSLMDQDSQMWTSAVEK